MTTDTFEQKFKRLKDEYIAQLPEKLAVIHDNWNSLKARHSVETIDLLHKNIHSLTSTSGTFGFTALYQSARNLELSLKPLIEHSTQNFSFNTELAISITANIQQLFALLEVIQQQNSAEPS